jgi:DNA-binding NarL/FixJ family response regulator
VAPRWARAASAVEARATANSAGAALKPLAGPLKDRVAEVERFIDALRRVAAGGSVLDPEVVAHMLGRRREEGSLTDLSPRERQVLELMAQGLSNKAICTQLVLTERAVEHHVTSIFAKLGLPASGREHRRVLAVLTFLQS